MPDDFLGGRGEASPRSPLAEHPERGEGLEGGERGVTKRIIYFGSVGVPYNTLKRVPHCDKVQRISNNTPRMIPA